MTRLAIAAGVLIGSAITYSQTRLPTRPPAVASRKAQAVPFQSGGLGTASIPSGPTILWQGATYQVSPYASPIPLYMQGGEVLHINGTVSKAVGD